VVFNTPQVCAALSKINQINLPRKPTVWLQALSKVGPGISKNNGPIQKPSSGGGANRPLTFSAEFVLPPLGRPLVPTDVLLAVAGRSESNWICVGTDSRERIDLCMKSKLESRYGRHKESCLTRTFKMIVVDLCEWKLGVTVLKSLPPHASLKCRVWCFPVFLASTP
jgi:hypothetical protein